eukprot:4841765-Pyramimonas_sp.AAC.1
MPRGGPVARGRALRGRPAPARGQWGHLGHGAESPRLARAPDRKKGGRRHPPNARCVQETRIQVVGARRPRSKLGWPWPWQS